MLDILFLKKIEKITGYLRQPEIPHKSSTVFKINRAVNQGRNLELVFVSVFFFRESFEEMYVFAVAYLDGGGGHAAEFMKMSV